MKKKNKKIAAVLTIIILLVAGVVFFVFFNEPDEKRPPSLSGKLKNTEADVENNTYRFEVILSNNESNPELKRDDLRMHMKVIYKNGTRDTYVIFRYREEYNESNKFSFKYIDQNGDGLISSGDIIEVRVEIEVADVEGYHFDFGIQGYGGSLNEHDKSEELP